MSLLVITFVSFIIGFIIGLLVGFSSKNNTGYWKGRGDGWLACENMVSERIKKICLKSDDSLKLWKKLLQ